MQSERAAAARRNRLVIVSDIFAPTFLTTGKLMGELAAALAALGWQVTAITGAATPDAPGSSEAARPEGLDAVEVIRTRVPATQAKHGLRRIAGWLRFCVSLVPYATQLRRADVAVVVSNPPLMPPMVACALLGSRARLVYVVHDLYPDIAALVGAARPSSLGYRVFDSLTCFALRRSRAVVAIGRDMGTYLRAHKGVPPERIATIPNWGDDRIEPLAKRSAFSEANGFGSGFVCMYTGNVGQFQGLEIVIEVAERLVANRGDIRFVIVGQGAQRPALEASVRDKGLHNVSFLDFQSEALYPTVLAMADCLLVSLQEGAEPLGVPSKTYNYLAAGRAILALVGPLSDIGVLVTSNECGVVVPGTDSEAVARALCAMADSPEATAAMGVRARQAFQASFTLAAAAARYDELFGSLMCQQSSL